MTDPEYDAEFEAFLKRRSPLHRRLSDIDNAEPSGEVDRLVLNRAREALDAPSQPLFRSSRWALPLGLAAAILIAFTVVLNIDHHAASSRSVASTGSSSAPEQARAAPVSDSARLDQPSVLSDSATHNGRASQTEKTAAAPAALAKRYDIPEAPDAAKASASSARLTASSRAAAPMAVAPPASSRDAASDPHSSPDAWLREINRLRAAGKTAEADRELVAFREAYPTHPAYSVARPPAR